MSTSIEALSGGLSERAAAVSPYMHHPGANHLRYNELSNRYAETEPGKYQATQAPRFL